MSLEWGREPGNTNTANAKGGTPATCHTPSQRQGWDTCHTPGLMLLMLS